jgi:hypothetical protein
MPWAIVLCPADAGRGNLCEHAVHVGFDRPVFAGRHNVATGSARGVVCNRGVHVATHIPGRCPGLSYYAPRMRGVVICANTPCMLVSVAPFLRGRAM